MPKIAVHDHISILLKKLAENSTPGQKVQKFLDIVDEYLQQNNLTSINKGYDDGRGVPFPYPVCININNCVAHGLPTPQYTLVEGMIIGFDLGIFDNKTKECSDAALTVGVGTIEKYNVKLLKIAKEAMYRGIDVVKPGVDIFQIGKEIDRYTQGHGYKVSKTFLGHAIGKKMHEAPTIPMVALRIEPGLELSDEYILKVGQKICIEPCISQYDDVGVAVGDGWSIITKDNRNSAMFEHVIEVTKDGYKILTTHIERE